MTVCAISYSSFTCFLIFYSRFTCFLLPYSSLTCCFHLTPIPPASNLVLLFYLPCFLLLQFHLLPVLIIQFHLFFSFSSFACFLFSTQVSSAFCSSTQILAVSRSPFSFTDFTSSFSPTLSYTCLSLTTVSPASCYLQFLQFHLLPALLLQLLLLI